MLIREGGLLKLSPNPDGGLTSAFRLVLLSFLIKYLLTSNVRSFLEISNFGLDAMTLLIDWSISQFHNHVQNVQAVVLAGHTSCKHGGLYD